MFDLYESRYYNEPFSRFTDKELLKAQSKGEQLTLEEKQRAQKLATKNRKRK